MRRCRPCCKPARANSRWWIPPASRSACPRPWRRRRGRRRRHGRGHADRRPPHDARAGVQAAAAEAGAGGRRHRCDRQAGRSGHRRDHRRDDDAAGRDAQGQPGRALGPAGGGVITACLTSRLAADGGFGPIPACSAMQTWRSKRSQGILLRPGGRKIASRKPSMNDSLQSSREAIARAAPLPALGHFLNHCLTTYAAENSGAAANYIPELSKANPAYFGIGLATIDGHVYEAGDSAVEFTIQSISKAFVFALALDLVGPERVEAKIGVEPSGEAFNSIRLTADNRPFNAMVNAGAIACSGLIHSVDGSGAFERVRDALSRFAGRELGVDEAVFESERATGDRRPQPRHRLSAA